MIAIKKLINYLKHFLDYYKALQGKGDFLWRFEKMREIGDKIIPEYRFKWPQMEWWNDEYFNIYLSRFNEVKGMNTDRRWMLYQLMRLIESVPGHTAECGVYQGASSYLICDINLRCFLHERKHFIFDSFEGISKPTISDGSHWTKGDLNCNIEVVRKN